MTYVAAQDFEVWALASNGFGDRPRAASDIKHAAANSCHVFKQIAQL